MKAGFTMFRNAATGVFILAVMALGTALILSACSKPTSAKTGNLTGSVVLVNDTNDTSFNLTEFDGVKVMLYHEAELDPDITSVNAAHPNIGVIITQQTEFDHRLQSPVKSVLTGADGSFTLEKIEPGSYNLAVMKEGWGIRYLYSLEIVEGDNSLADAQRNSSNSTHNRAVVELYPAEELSGFKTENFTFRANHTYHVTDDVRFTAGVTFEALSDIRIEPAKKMEFYALINSPGAGSDFVRITSADEMYSDVQVTPDQIGRFYNCECYAGVSFGQNILRSFAVSFSNLGWVIKNSHLEISNMLLRYNRVGLGISNATGIYLHDSLVQYGSDPINGGITFASCDSLESKDLIVMNGIVGFSHDSCESAAISNSYFKDNSLFDLRNSYYTVGSVSHCTFANAVTAIMSNGFSNSNIQYCQINGATGIFNDQIDNFPSSTITANYNNIICTVYGVITKAKRSIGSFVHLDAKNNYWGTTNQEQIASLIWDHLDEDENGQWYLYYNYYIDYQPYRYSAVSNAGVQ